MEKIFKYIINNVSSNKIGKQEGAKILKMLRDESIKPQDDIAIIGIGFRLPSAGNMDEYWDNIINKIDCTGSFPDMRRKDIDNHLRLTGEDKAKIDYYREAYLEKIDEFDYKLFRISPREASVIDPYQRVFLQTVWQAVEDAGYGGSKIAGSNTGVFVGYASNANDCYYKIVNTVDPSLASIAIVGNISAIIPTRVSYLLDLHGPTMVIDTACSSSLVAVHQACNSIKNGDCSMAIAGGIKINLIPLDRDNTSVGFESSDGYTRSFDNNSDGAGKGEGVLAVILKSLAEAKRDRDNIYAVIKGAAINQDGTSMSITAPNPDAQINVILKAWEDAGIDPSTLSYIEAHGSATKLGDPIEIEALTKAFEKYTDKKQICPIGTVKSTMGHTFECSGLTGLLNVIMALRHKEIPPLNKFNIPNSSINFYDSPVYINNYLRKWENKGSPMRCAISSFGLSGTNCHMVLEEAPKFIETDLDNELQIFCISAKSKKALEGLIRDYDEFLKKANNLRLTDICYTANTGRGHYNYRIAFPVKSLEEFKERIHNLYLIKSFNDMTDCFYGEHKIVSSNKKSKTAGEITEKEKIELNTRAEKKAVKMELKELCALYTQGADIDWDILYGKRTGRRISIPTYPFDNHRCWIEISDEVAETSEECNIFYSMEWKREKISKEQESLAGTVLIISPEKAKDREFTKKISAYYGEKGRDVIKVTIGEEFEKIGNNTYIISNSRNDYIKLFLDLQEKELTQIVHLLTMEETGYEVTDIKLLEESQKRSFYSLYYLAYAVNSYRPEEKLDLILLSEGINEVTGGENIRPENAQLLGIGKVINKEFPNLKSRCIDIDKFTAVAEIIPELECISEDYCIAYRHGVRYIESFNSVDIKDAEDKELQLKEEGVYVITGGAGGIGLEIAGYFALKNKVKLALLGRSKIPVRGKWEEVLTESEDELIKKKIGVIKWIESLGAEVEYCRADVSDMKEMEEVLTGLKNKYGHINGVVHCAGVSRDEPLMKKEESDFQEVLLPKVQGTWILDRLTASEDMDFFMMSSSVATIFSMQGQGDYVAANSYLDSYAAYRNKQGKRTLTINWTTWKETGMAFNSRFVVDTIFKTLPTARGIEGFERLLESDEKRALVGEINYEGIGLHLLERSGVRLSAEIREKMNRYQERTKAGRSGDFSRARSNTGELKLSGRENSKYNEVEKELAKICQEVLGFDEIDIYDNFFELGADSIMLMKIQDEIEKKLPVKISAADMFEYSTIVKLAEHIVSFNEELAEKAGRPSREREGNIRVETAGNEIAIIGIDINLPMAESIEDYWSNIKNGLDCVAVLPESRQGDVRRYIKLKNIPLNNIEYNTGAFIEKIDKFDYTYFRIPPKEARLTDPNHRIFLQSAWKTIEDAGYGGTRIKGSNTGIYLGFAPSQMYFLWLINDFDPSLLSSATVGNTAAVATGRLSYLLDLKGPSMVVDTACSSSLVAVHMACKSILTGDCDMAVAGGVRLSLAPVHKKGEQLGIGMDSSDGRARTFDDNSDGTGSGEGVAAILLKPLSKAVEDGDNIYAVIKGSASNQDGSSAGITAPNPAAQEEVIRKAWEDADIDPETISYIETHGTGTQLGDSIEIQGIRNAFENYTAKKQFCAVSSVKTNIAHLSEAAGIAGLINAVLALRNKEIPPSMFFRRPNRKIDFNDSPVYVNTRSRKWETDGHPGRCGVSAFGLSGTNCHVVLEEYIETEDISGVKPAVDSLNVLTLSTKSEESLGDLVRDYRSFLNRDEDPVLKNICYTAGTGREHHNVRLAVIVKNMEDLKQKIEKINSCELDEIQEAGVYYGTYKVVPESKEDRLKGEITERERQEFCREADLRLKEYLEDSTDKGSLARICQLYADGADIDWGLIYTDDSLKKVSLPTYPFEARRCWIEIPEYDEIEFEVQKGGDYHLDAWIKEELKDVSIREETGPVLIFKGDTEISSDLVSEFRRKDREVIEIGFAERYEKEGENNYRITGTQEDYNRLFEDIKARGPVKLLHLLTLGSGSGIDTIEELKESQERGVYSLLRINKAVAKAGMKNRIDIVLLSSYVAGVLGREERINPWNAPLFGLGKVVRLENSNMLCRCIDIDDATGVESIMVELEADTVDYHVAYRRSERYIREFREFEIEDTEDSKIEIREEGVYIVTGGTGGIGIEISRYLAAGRKVKIALIGRSEIPDRKEWDEEVKTGRNKKLIQKINDIKKIESMGAEVVYYSADVSDMGRMEYIVNELKERYGRINGIVHAAGIAGGGFLFQEEEEEFNEVLYPKVHGTWILDQLTGDQDLDFFMMCSSIASIFPGKGQGDYAAANSYLDSFAAYGSRQQKKTLAVNWVAWRDTGMAVEYGVNVDSTFKVLPTAKAIRALDEVLNKDIDRLAIGELNYGTDNMAALNGVPLRLSPGIDKAVNQVMEKLRIELQARKKSLNTEVKLNGRNDKGYSEIESKLASIYSEVLGFSELDIYDNFFELGGDSILLSDMYELIETEFPGKVRLLDLFEYTSISKLADFISGNGEGEDRDDKGVGERSDEEIEEEVYKILNNMEEGELSIDEVIDSLDDLE